MRVSLGQCTGTAADFLDLSCWGVSTVPVNNVAGTCAGGSPNLTPAQVAACNAANSAAANALCVSNPAACANYEAVTCLNPDGTPTGNCNPLCYLAGLCDTNGNLTSTAWVLMAALGLAAFAVINK